MSEAKFIQDRYATPTVTNAQYQNFESSQLRVSPSPNPHSPILFTRLFALSSAVHEVTGLTYNNAATATLSRKVGFPDVGHLL